MCRQAFQHSGLPSAHAGTVWMLRTFLAFRSRNLVRGAPQQRRLNGCRKLRRLLHSVARLSAIQWPRLTLRWQAAGLSLFLSLSLSLSLSVCVCVCICARFVCVFVENQRVLSTFFHRKEHLIGRWPKFSSVRYKRELH